MVCEYSQVCQDCQTEEEGVSVQKKGRSLACVPSSLRPPVADFGGVGKRHYGVQACPFCLKEESSKSQIGNWNLDIGAWTKVGFVSGAGDIVRGI